MTAPYSEARKEAMETGKPLFVIVGADWCPACQTMKNDVIPKMQRRGEFPDVAYATVNWDRENKLAVWFQKQAKTDLIPVLCFYWKVDGGWKSRYHVGSMEAKKLQEFLQVRKE
jgi:thiol:disulfide interchange protein